MSHYRVTYLVNVEAASLGAVAELVIHNLRRACPQGRFIECEKYKGERWVPMMPRWVKTILIDGDQEDIAKARRQMDAQERRRRFHSV